MNIIDEQNEPKLFPEKNKTLIYKPNIINYPYRSVTRLKSL